MNNFTSRWQDHFTRLTTTPQLGRSARYGILVLILLACLGIRLWTVDTPGIDRTHWKEIDYIMISVNYWENGYHFFKPEVEWPAEPPRVTAMELPLVPYVAALLYGLFGFSPLTVRLPSIAAWLLVCIYVYRLSSREFNDLVGLGAALAAAAIPLCAQHGRILLSEPLVIAFSVMTVYHFAEWVDRRRRGDWLMALAAFTLAVALKLTPLYLLLPLSYTMVRRHGLDLPRYGPFVLFVTAALLLPVAWFSHARYLAATSIDVFGIFGGKAGGHNKFQTLTMLTDPVWYARMYKQVAWDLLGPMLGSSLFVAGIAAAIRVRRGGLLFAYLGAILAFFVIVAEGQIDAPYRQLTGVPPFAAFLALGAVALWSAICSTRWRRAGTPVDWIAGRPLALATLCLALVGAAFGGRLNRIFWRDPLRPMSWGGRWELAQAIREHSAPGSKIITLGAYTIHAGGNDLSPVIYYFSGRQGWTLEPKDWNLDLIDDLIERGATHLVAIDMKREPSSFPFLSQLKQRFELVHEVNDATFVLDLRGRTRRNEGVSPSPVSGIPAPAPKVSVIPDAGRRRSGPKDHAPALFHS